MFSRRFRRRRNLREDFIDSANTSFDALSLDGRLDSSAGDRSTVGKLIKTSSTDSLMNFSLNRNLLHNPLFSPRSPLKFPTRFRAVSFNLRKRQKAFEDPREEIQLEESDCEREDSDEELSKETSSKQYRRRRILNISRFRSSTGRKRRKKKKPKHKSYLSFLRRAKGISLTNGAYSDGEVIIDNNINKGSTKKVSKGRYSETSPSNSADEETEVDVLSKYENLDDSVHFRREKPFVLFTDTGRRVLVSFCEDFLKVNHTTIFYEDLASWTNDKKCLHLMYVKNKNKSSQERVELKLYVSDKQYKDKATPYKLNELLREKITALVTQRFEISHDEAMHMTELKASRNDISKLAKAIDKGSRILEAEGNKPVISALALD